MKPRHLRAVPAETPAPSDGDYEMFRQRRLRDHGAPPEARGPRGPVLEREPLVKERRLGDVIDCAIIDRPTRPSSPWSTVLFGLLIVLALLGAAGIAKAVLR